MKNKIISVFLLEVLTSTKLIRTQNKIDKLNKKLKDEYGVLTSKEVEKIRSKILKFQVEIVKLKNLEL